MLLLQLGHIVVEQRFQLRFTVVLLLLDVLNRPHQIGRLLLSGIVVALQDLPEADDLVVGPVKQVPHLVQVLAESVYHHIG